MAGRPGAHCVPPTLPRRPPRAAAEGPALAGLSAAGALAGEARPRHVTAPEPCATEHLARDGAAEAACVGRVAGRCLEDAATTEGMTGCLAGGPQARDAIVDADSPELMRRARTMDAAEWVGALDLPPCAARLCTARRRLLAWRGAEPAARRVAWGAGSHGRVVAAEGWLALTGGRTLERRGALEELQE